MNQILIAQKNAFHPTLKEDIWWQATVIKY